MYPGRWRHGDWIRLTDRGTAYLGTLRLDAETHGVRMGSGDSTARRDPPEVSDSFIWGLNCLAATTDAALRRAAQTGAELDEASST